MLGRQRKPEVGKCILNRGLGLAKKSSRTMGAIPVPRETGGRREGRGGEKEKRVKPGDGGGDVRAAARQARGACGSGMAGAEGHPCGRGLPGAPASGEGPSGQPSGPLTVTSWERWGLRSGVSASEGALVPGPVPSVGVWEMTT